ncbi:MAG: hypothetical protein MK165_19255 [Pirellulaceae bacterium]|nr:hypothetical protein [Pirellulaceae bacterium]
MHPPPMKFTILSRHLDILCGHIGHCHSLDVDDQEGTSLRIHFQDHCRTHARTNVR